MLVYNAFVESGSIALRDAGTGEEVPIEIVDSMEGDSLVRRLVPLAELQALTTYTVEGDAGYGTARLPVSFTTGDGPDADAPEALVLEGVEAAFIPATQWVLFVHMTDSCGDRLRLRPDIVDAAEDPHAWYEVQVAWDEDFAEAATVTDADREDVWAGWGLCTSSVPELRAGDEVWVRARAVDLSGNEGPWSEAVHIRSIPTDACGCSTAGEARGGAVGSALLALAALGRRRRSAHRSASESHTR